MTSFTITKKTKTTSKTTTPPPTITKTTERTTPTKTRQRTTTTRTPKTTKYAHHPNYELDTLKKRWVRKSDIRPIELVNQHKAFLIDYLIKNSKLDKKQIEMLVKKHSTSEKTLSKILIEKGVFTQKQSDMFFRRYNFWQYALCKHMKKICPTETDLRGRDWCALHEDIFCYFKDEKSNVVSCYSVDDITFQLSSALAGGEEEDMAHYQLPRDPYTRKVWTEEFIKHFLKQLRYQYKKGNLREFHAPHVVYFLRHYKKFYKDPAIKPFLSKTTLTKQEKWKVSDAIEDFLSETGEIEPDWTEGPKRWWFWKDDETEPEYMMAYIFQK